MAFVETAKWREWGRAASSVARHLRSVSFSNYGEDVVLYHMKPQRQGFYLDVGAYHPQRLSNTYKLYVKGWRGITVEPNPDAAGLFRRVRPRDTHLVVGVSPAPATLIYHRFRNPVLNSFDTAQAERMRADVIDSVEIACLPLQDIVRSHAGGENLDLLSVDCEGQDLEVLQSLDWSTTRPTVLIVEDFEQFELNRDLGGAGAIRRFMVEQGYALAAQTIFSFIYIDRAAFTAPRETGFRLDRSQLDLLA